MNNIDDPWFLPFAGPQMLLEYEDNNLVLVNASRLILPKSDRNTIDSLVAPFFVARHAWVAQHRKGPKSSPTKKCFFFFLSCKLTITNIGVENIAGWWFGTLFMFHNLWDNPSH